MTATHRKEPGSTGEGEYFHLIVRPKDEFVFFHTRDVGRQGHSQLVLGKTKDGKWGTHKWLISKKDAYITTDGDLKSDDFKVQRIIDYCNGNLVHREKDIFQIQPCDHSRKHRSCRKEECPEMYFENYDEYDRYFADHTVTNH